MCDNSSENHDIMFVLGPPGSGKSSLCKHIEETFGFTHLSAGELLRAEVDRKVSSFGEIISKHIEEGTIVPIEVTCRLIEDAINKAGNSRGFLIDGFPRDQNNLDGWIREMGTEKNIRLVLNLLCDFETCKTRCLKRNDGRTDDNEESFVKRIETYIRDTVSVIKNFEARGLIRVVRTAGTAAEIQAVVDDLLKTEGFSPLK